MDTAEEVVDAASTQAPSSSLAVFDPVQSTLADLRQRYANVAFDLRTVKGNDEARKARKELVTLRASVDKIYTAWNQPLLEQQRKARELCAEVKGEILKLETPIDEQIKADERRREEERMAKEAAEAARVKAIRDRINDIFAQPAACAGLPSGEIELSIVGVEVLIADKAFYEEFQAEAEAAADVVLTKLRSMRDAARAAEEQAERQRLEAERLAAERAELERQRAEFEARQRAEQERQERERAEAERQAREAREAEERAIREQREAEERRIAAEREAAEADLRARRAALEAEERSVREAAEAQRLEAERLESERLAALQRARQEDAFQEERAKAQAAADAAPRQVVRPADEALTGAVAKAFKVDARVAAEWLGSYDALAEIDRISQEASK